MIYAHFSLGVIHDGTDFCFFFFFFSEFFLQSYFKVEGEGSVQKIRR